MDPDFSMKSAVYMYIRCLQGYSIKYRAGISGWTGECRVARDPVNYGGILSQHIKSITTASLRVHHDKSVVLRRIRKWHCRYSSTALLQA